jgi:hypothetical protein
VRISVRLSAFLTVVALALLPAAAGADEIGPSQPLKAPPHESSGVPLLEVGRWLLIALAFVAIFGALIVKRRAVRAALRHEPTDQSNAS